MSLKMEKIDYISSAAIGVPMNDYRNAMIDKLDDFVNDQEILTVDYWDITIDGWIYIGFMDGYVEDESTLQKFQEALTETLGL